MAAGNDLYKIILVDDEDEVRGRISSKISEESGFTIVGTAGNGYDALELIEKLSPSVVLTDIKMPFIDGIELASHIRRDFPTVKVAFITGFDEFEYAREAINLNVSSYLTKPVTQEDISAFLKKLKEDLDREFQEKYNLERLQKSYDENLPLLLDNCFASYLVSTGKDKKIAIENLQSCGVDLERERYLMARLQIERDGTSWDLLEFERIKHALRSMVHSSLERNGFFYHSFRFSDGIFLLIKEKNGLFLKEIDPVLFEMVKLAEKFLSLSINIGVSELRTGFKQLDLAYEESCKALDQSQFLNTGRIIYIKQLQESIEKPVLLSLSEEEVNTLEQVIRFGSENEIRDQMNSIKMNGLKNSKGRINFSLYSVNLVNILIRYAAFIGVDLNQVAGEDVLEKMIRLRSLEQVFDWVLTLVLKLKEQSMQTRLSGSQRILEQAVSIIEKEYTNPRLSMDLICEELDISVSYLSLLFRKNRDTTFVKYLTRIRMERACELLRLTGDKIVDLAGQCGYSDVYYFSHSFKKYTGVSPKKYREEILS